MRTALRNLWALALHLRAGYNFRTLNDDSCGCEFAVPKWLR